MEASSEGSAALTRSTVSMTLAPAILKMMIRMAGLPLAQAGSVRFEVESMTDREIFEAHRRAGCRVVADDEGRIVARFEELIVGVDIADAMVIPEVAGGHVLVDRAERGAQGLRGRCHRS